MTRRTLAKATAANGITIYLAVETFDGGHLQLVSEDPDATNIIGANRDTLNVIAGWRAMQLAADIATEELVDHLNIFHLAACWELTLPTGSPNLAKCLSDLRTATYDKDKHRYFTENFARLDQLTAQVMDLWPSFETLLSMIGVLSANCLELDLDSVAVCLRNAGYQEPFAYQYAIEDDIRRWTRAFPPECMRTMYA